MAKTLFISDMDGTLLGADARLSQRTIHMLRQLSQAGVDITVATARTPATVQPLMEPAHLHIPAIVMTGAARWDFSSQSYSSMHLMTPALAQSIESAFAAAGLAPFIYIIQDGHPLQVFHAGRTMSSCERKFADERTGLPLKRIYLNAEPDHESPRILYFGMGDPDTVDAAAALVRRAHPDICMSVYRDTYCPAVGLIEVFAPGVSKANAAIQLKAELGADRIVVYGDNLNDLPMMAVADLSVAVANAHPEVLSAADIVIGPNTDDAVPRHIAALTDNPLYA